MRLRHALLMVLGLAGTASAQTPWEWNTTVEARPRFEYRDNRDFTSEKDDERRDSLFRLRLNFQAVNASEGLSFFFQPQMSYSAARIQGDTNDRTLLSTHQLYVQSRHPESRELMVRAGRQELVFGNERLVGAFGWDNIGRSFDGVRVDYAKGGGVTSAFATQLGQSASRPTKPKFYGVYHANKVQPDHTVDLYALYKHDKARSGALTTETDVTTVGARSQKKWKSGPDYTAEAAYQFGETADKDIEAWAWSVNAGYSLDWKCAPRLAVEYNNASGGDPSDPDEYRTFDQLFPTNHNKYGVADYQGWRNMRNLRLSASAKPMDSWTLSLDHHWFWLQNNRDYWYGAAGRPNLTSGGTPLRDATGASGREVGRELDIIASVAATRDLSLEAGYAHFTPGSYIRSVSGDADVSDWWYVQATWKH